MRREGMHRRQRGITLAVALLLFAACGALGSVVLASEAWALSPAIVALPSLVPTPTPSDTNWPPPTPRPTPPPTPPG